MILQMLVSSSSYLIKSSLSMQLTESQQQKVIFLIVMGARKPDRLVQLTEKTKQSLVFRN